MQPNLTRGFYHLVLKFFWFIPLLSIVGCSQFNCTRLEGVLGGPTNLISFSYNIADSLIENALPPLIPNHPDMVILTTTFVDNNDLGKTSKFGRLIQEHTRSRFSQKGFTVRDIKLGDSLYIEPGSGETILTRDLTKLQGGQDAQAVVVGTISRSNRILYISSRLINPSNSTIIASVDYRLCMDDEILDLLNLQLLDEGDTTIEEPSQPFLNTFL